MTDLEILRAQLAHLDDALIQSLIERQRISLRVQRLKVDAGGARVDVGQENVVIKRYTDRLGDPGRYLANEVLNFCVGDAEPGDVREL